MQTVADLIDETLMNKENVATIASVRTRINAMMEQYPLFQFAGEAKMA
jgi:glycine/serine hydroxymethyltransferase